MNKRKILILAGAVEGLLAVMYCAWIGFSSEPPAGGSNFPTREMVLRGCCWGCLAVIPLWLINWLLLRAMTARSEKFAATREFVDEIAKPLADILDWRSAAAVALLAGVGEELFFRGILQNEMGLFGASVCFSLIHFGTALYKFRFLAVLYALVGCYLGLVYQYSGTLWAPVVAHAVYDFAALLYLKHVYERTQ